MEPSPRWGHCSAAIDGKLYVWGGHTKEFSKEKASSMHLFDPITESWETKSTTGPSPPGVYGGVSASVGQHLYQYGGQDHDTSSHGSFYTLNTSTLQWQELPSGDAMEKSFCGMAGCGDQLLLLGGAGHPSGHTQPGADFAKWFNSGTGTNEFHIYTVKDGKL